VAVAGDGVQQADAALTAGGWVSPGGTISTTPVTYPSHSVRFFARAAATIELDKVSQQNSSRDVLADQIQGAAVGLYSLVAKGLWAEATPSNAPPGMATFASEHPAGLLDVNGPLTLSLFSCMNKFMDPASPTSPIYFVMNPRLFNYTLELLRGRGVDAHYVYDALIGGRVPEIDGFRMLKNSHVEVAGDNTTRLYCVRIGWGADDPVSMHGVLRGYNALRGPLLRVDPQLEDGGAPDQVSCTLSLDVLWIRGMLNAVLAGIGIKL
jgi:hypothetical protein